MRPVRRQKRSKIKSNNERKRLSIFKSMSNIYAQIIDDESGTTLAQASSIKMDKGYNVAAAKEVGKNIAEAAKKAGISMVIFDRGNRRYQGRIQALAEAARENGLNF